MSGRDCIIVDPGSQDNAQLNAFLQSEKLNPQFLILTHEHFDHCWGVNKIRADYPSVKLVCSLNCSAAIQNRKKNYSVFYQQPGFDVSAADIILENINWALYWKEYKISFFPAKGHTLSGTIFSVGRYIFTGDELLKDYRTVTKLKTGSKDELRLSLNLLSSMKGERKIVCPGHGVMFELDGYDLSAAIICDGVYKGRYK